MWKKTEFFLLHRVVHTVTAGRQTVIKTTRAHLVTQLFCTNLALFIRFMCRVP